MKKTIILSLFISALYVMEISSQTYQSTWESIDKRPIPEWFTDAKFGIFIHWGVYSVPSWGPTGDMHVYSKYAEWYWYRLMNEEASAHEDFAEFHNSTFGEDTKYQDFAPSFNAEMFNPVQWAQLFKKSGARYVVLTSKHHEGFCLWPSEESWNWNSMDIGAHRDLAGDLIKAVKSAGLHMGFYYSLYEWFNPLYHGDVNRYVDQHMLPQMKDLVLRYQPDIIWPDGEWDHPSEVWRSTEYLSWLYNESPVKDHVVVNDRWGKETRGKHGGYYTTEYGLVHSDALEQKMSHPWEECRGIGGSFGYNRNENLDDYSSGKELVHLLIDMVSKGGNLLLNIGPTADGRIPVIMQQRLMEMGEWLEINGDAIYGTQAWENGAKNTNQVKFTRKGQNLYAILLSWPEKEIVIEEIKLNKNHSIKMMGAENKNIVSRYSDGKLTIEPISMLPSEAPGRFAWVFKIEGLK